MGRPESALDPERGPVQRLAWELRRLRDAAGRPSYRVLAKRAHFSASTLAETAKGSRLPSLEVTLAYAAACGGDPTEWTARWRAAAAELAATRRPEESRSPYPGLASLSTSDAEFFFGRERLVAEVLAGVDRARLVAVLGASGSGKSSLLLAGVVPQLAERAAIPIVFTPGDRPLAALAAAVSEAAGDDAADRMRPELDRDPAALEITLGSAEAGQDTRFVLVADQFEEVFTQCADPAERDRFLDALADLVRAPDNRTTGSASVVLAVRADFYPHCTQHAGLVAALRKNVQVPIGSPGREELRQIIVEPAARAGLTVEPDLVATLLAEAEDQPGALPLVAHALRETWGRRAGAALRLADYRDSGGVHGAVAQTAERVYGDLDDRGRAAARAIVVRLTALGDGTEDTRRRIARQELAGVGPDEVISDVLDRLAAARLVVLGPDTVEVAHEALIRAWPRLRRWLADDRESVRAHRRLTESATEWHRAGRDEAYLYRGARLAAWADGEPATGAEPPLNELENAFLAASRDQEDRQRNAARRRVRLGFTTLAATVVVVTLLAVLAVVQTGRVTAERDLAVSRQLVAAARSQLQVDPELALLLAQRAYDTMPTAETEAMLRQAVATSRVRARLAPGHGPAYGVALDRTGRRVATSGDDGAVRLWNWAGTERPLTPARTLTGHEGQVWSPVFSPDGRYLAAAGVDSLVLVWDLTTGGRPRTLAGHEGPVWNLAFSPDGSRLASASDDGTVRLWDHRAGGADDTDVPGGGAGGPSPVVLDTGHGRALGVAFSPGGGLLATSGEDGVLRLWRPETRRMVTELRGHDGTVEDIAFGPAGLLASASTDGTARVWDAHTGEELTLLAGHDGTVESVAINPAGTHVATTGNDGTIRIWDVRTGSDPVVLRGHKGIVWDATFDPSGRWLASASHDQSVRFWHAAPTGGEPVLRDRVGGMWTVAFGPDGRRLAAGGDDGAVRVTGSNRDHGPLTLTGHEDWIVDLAWRPDGRGVGSVSADGTVRLWPVAPDGEPAETVVLRGPDTGVRSVAYDPIADRIATGWYDGTVRVWPASGNGAPVTFRASEEWIADLRFSPDGRLLATAGKDGVLRLWPAGRIGRVDLTPTRRLAARSPVNVVAFSADGRLLASVGEDGTVRVWEVATGTERAALRGHQGIVWTVAFSPDGRWLASGGEDGTLRLWPAAGGPNHVVLDGFGASVESVGFDRHGRIAVALGDGTVRVWECAVCGPIEDVVELSRSRVTRELSVDEIRTYLDS